MSTNPRKPEARSADDAAKARAAALVGHVIAGRYRVDELLAKARVMMDRETEEKTRRALMRRTLREELALPRLTLLAE